MSVTAKDIANRLGLSQPTVSRILSGARGYRVAPETRRRVLEMARELGYQPNAVARSLRYRRTNILGFYTGYGYLDARNDFLTDVIGGLQRGCDQHHYDLLLHGTYRTRTTDALYAELANGRVDGVFLHTSPDDPLIERIAASPLRVVAIADRIPGLPSVLCDDEDGICQLLDYLWARGHRRIAYMAPQLRLASVERRRETFEQELARRGLTEAERPVFRIHMEEASQCLDDLLAHRPAPTAVCCWNDRAAYNLLHGCQTRGLAVPDQLAIVGFDGFVDWKAPSRHLVTISAHWADVTQAAVELLLQQIRGEEVPAEKTFPVSLIPGDTA